jgi:hypothetical protein
MRVGKSGLVLFFFERFQPLVKRVQSSGDEQSKEGRGLTGVVVQLPIRDVEPGPVEAFQHQAPVV